MSALGVRDEYAIAAGAIGDSGVGKSTMVYSLEKWRAWNPDTERFADDEKANAMLTRNYRAPYTVPDKV